MNITVVVVTAIICFTLCYICKVSPKADDKQKKQKKENNNE